MVGSASERYNFSWGGVGFMVPLRLYVNWGCNDDTQEYKCGSEAGGWHSHVVVPVTQGSVYLIRIGGWNEGSVGTAELLINLN